MNPGNLSTRTPSVLNDLGLVLDYCSVSLNNFFKELQR